jgi:hypothetical protein
MPGGSSANDPRAAPAGCNPNGNKISGFAAAKSMKGRASISVQGNLPKLTIKILHMSKIG